MKLAKRLTMKQAGGETDPYWSNVSLCINASGVDGSTSIVDAKGNALTLVGNTQIDTSLGYPAIEYDGNGDTVSVANSAPLVLGSDDHTMEAWVYPQSFALIGGSTNRGFLSKGPGSTAGFALIFNTSGNIIWYNNMARFTTSVALALNTLQHVAFTLTGGVLRAFIGGAPAGATAFSVDLSSTAEMLIGSSLTSDGWFWGKMPAVRITKGVARWTSAFTPPAFPFPTS